MEIGKILGTGLLAVFGLFVGCLFALLLAALSETGRESARQACQGFPWRPVVVGALTAGFNFWCMLTHSDIPALPALASVVAGAYVVGYVVWRDPERR